MIPWTPQQLAFFARLCDTDDSIILRACAGSGKTTTLVAGVEHLRGSVLAVAFNVRIKKTLEEKISHLAVCKTLNGLGHGAMIRFFGHKVEIDSGKIHKIVKDLLNERENKKNWELYSPVVQLVSLAKQHGIVPNSTPGQWKSLLPDEEESWAMLADHYDVDISYDILALARQVLRASNTLAWKGICDFNDQLYIPVCWGAAFDKFDNVIIDEAQDLSQIQHKMLQKVLKRGGRLLAVGDENQAIYGFRGASASSIAQLTETFGLKELELTVSFRCAKNIVLEAQKIVPRIEPAENAPPGVVLSFKSYVAEVFEDGDAILCRNNSPIITIAYKLIAAGKGVKVAGRNIGAGLKALVKRFTKHNPSISLDQLEISLDSWRDAEVEKAMATEKWSKAMSIDDKVKSLQAVISYSGASDVAGVITATDELFSKSSGAITLSSVHRAKGLEWERVFFLDEHLVPSIWAVKAFKASPERHGWMMQEEENIRYVAVTRAKQQLTYINSKGLEDGT